MEKLLLTVEEFGVVCGIAKSSAYQLVKSGRVRTVRMTPRGSMRVPVAAVQEFIDSLASAVQADQSA